MRSRVGAPLRNLCARATAHLLKLQSAAVQQAVDVISLVVLRDSAGWIDCACAFTRRTRIIYCQSINLALQRAYSGVYAKTATSPKLSRSEFIGQGGIFLVSADWH